VIGTLVAEHTLWSWNVVAVPVAVETSREAVTEAVWSHAGVGDSWGRR